MRSAAHRVRSFGAVGQAEAAHSSARGVRIQRRAGSAGPACHGGETRWGKRRTTGRGGALGCFFAAAGAAVDHRLPRRACSALVPPQKRRKFCSKVYEHCATSTTVYFYDPWVMMTQHKHCILFSCARQDQLLSLYIDIVLGCFSLVFPKYIRCFIFFKKKSRMMDGNKVAILW